MPRTAGPGRPPGNKTLREIAADAEYTHGEFTMNRLAENASMLVRWKRDLENRDVPAELEGMTVKDAWNLYRKEVVDLIEQERSWAPFFHPTLKATELTGANGSELFKDISDTERAARLVAVLDGARERRDHAAPDGGQDMGSPAGTTDGGIEQ